jgi:hypothetical protein
VTYDFGGIYGPGLIDFGDKSLGLALIICAWY